MATALPMTQYNKERGKIFASKFTVGKHIVQVQVAYKTVNVEIEFEYVKVIPEGVTAIHSLINCNKEIFNNFNNQYNLNVDNSYFLNKKILHVSIGEGTTEYPLTDDIDFIPNVECGSNNGVGHAINKALEEFKGKFRLEEYTRQQFSSALINKSSKYHAAAVDIVSDYMEKQANAILIKTKKRLQDISNDCDIICVYGGGSIQMREHIENKIKAICDVAYIQLLYIPTDYAITLEVEGLYKFATSDLFVHLREVALTK